MREFSTTVRPEVGEDVSPEASSALASAINEFAFDLWRLLPAGQGNAALSPTSISLALAMTWAGARGETADQVAKVLRFDDAGEIHRAAAPLLHRWNDPDRDLNHGFVLRVLNRLFGEDTFDFKQDYLRLVERSYGAPLERVDFRADSETSRTRINDWIEEQTAGRIRDLLAPGTVDALTRLVLTNVVYFLGKWVHPFDEDSTRDEPFRIAGAEIQVRTMCQWGSFRYAEDADVQIVELPYHGRNFVMTFLLPRADDGLPDLERRLTSSVLDGWLNGLERVSTLVTIPKFEIDPAGPLSLKPVLVRMGMPAAFDATAADFTAIAEPTDQAGLYISDVVHKCFVKVDEDGTEAAAATAVIMRMLSMPPGPSREFRADHPFLFLIRDFETGAILFMGRVQDPRPES